jgi:hypothetical protein
MSTRSWIVLKTSEHYQGVYCHYDGYPKHVGSLLVRFYNTEQKIERLLAKGNLISLRKTIEESEFFEEEEDKPYLHLDCLIDLEKRFQKNVINYVYLFQEGLWWVLKQGETEWRLISLRMVK